MGELVEDELAHWPITGADIQDRDLGIWGKREQVAQELKSLGARRVSNPLPRDPFFDIRVGRPIVMIASLHVGLQRLKSTPAYPYYGSTITRAGRSVCPSDRPGATQSRTRCFSSLASGKRPCAARDQIVSPSTRTSKTPPLPGSNATSPRSAANVVNNSWAIHAARNSHRHCVQYSISTRGCLGIFLTLYVGVLL